MSKMYDELEVKVNAEDKLKLLAHVEAINNILDKYPYFIDAKSHFATTMARAKSAAKECGDWVRRLDVEKKESEDIT